MTALRNSTNYTLQVKFNTSIHENILTNIVFLYYTVHLHYSQYLDINIILVPLFSTLPENKHLPAHQSVSHRSNRPTAQTVPKGNRFGDCIREIQKLNVLGRSEKKLLIIIISFSITKLVIY